MEPDYNHESIGYVEQSEEVPQKSQSNSKDNIFKKKRGNFFLRQDLKSLTPECNPSFSIIFNLFIIIIFLGIGIPIMIYSENINEHIHNYTNCTTNNITDKCTLSLNIIHEMKAPIFVYYQLDNFYLNHRYIVKSKIWQQLRGIIHVDSTNNSKCEGAIYMSEIFDNPKKYLTYKDKPLNANDYANPCGLMAKSYFTDEYKLYDSSNKSVFINETNISNQFEKNEFYKRHPDSEDLQWVDVQNEHFINWMAMETFSNFRKLWGRIDNDLKPDNYTIIINNNYDIYKYNAEKSIVLTSSNTLGYSSFIGYSFIFGSSVSFLISLVLWVIMNTNQNKKFDYTALKWK